MEFVAFLGNDKENWGQITALVNRLDCENAVLVKDKSVESIPSTEKKCEVINVNSESPLTELKEDMLKKLKGKIEGAFEVAVSLASGSGKEHMALISALLSIPVGIKLVVYTKNGIEFIN